MDSEGALRILEECEARHKVLARRIEDIGLILPGSIVKRYMRCGRSSCACHKDPPSLHGPYHYWSTKVGGKTVTRLLSSRRAEIIQRWLDNRAEMDDIIARMKEISQDAFEATAFLVDEEKGDSPSKKP